MKGSSFRSAFTSCVHWDGLGCECCRKALKSSLMFCQKFAKSWIAELIRSKWLLLSECRNILILHFIIGVKYRWHCQRADCSVHLLSQICWFIGVIGCVFWWRAWILFWCFVYNVINCCTITDCRGGFIVTIKTQFLALWGSSEVNFKCSFHCNWYNCLFLFVFFSTL